MKFNHITVYSILKCKQRNPGTYVSFYHILTFGLHHTISDNKISGDVLRRGIKRFGFDCANVK